MAECRFAWNTAEFKSKVALEALREQQPIHEIARRYQVIFRDRLVTMP